MKNQKIWLVLCAAFICVLTAPDSVFACACCAEPGTYRISARKPDNYQFDLLSKMKFASETELYMTEAGEDGVKGLDQIFQKYTSESWTAESISFDLTNSFANKTWKLSFKNAKGQTGALSLPIPVSMVNFAADIHDGRIGGGGGPLLYKEWRFKGNVGSGTGFFQKGIIAPTTYFLVFQGRGNNCDNAEDFTHWRVEINGKKADYAFYGEMNAGS
ncbi:MAG: hypothetical protein ABI954_06400 [Pyrinomonadaceae bacterium]